jgi:hypothetical protein
VDEKHNQTICKNSLPRQWPVQVPKENNFDNLALEKYGKRHLDISDEDTDFDFDDTMTRPLIFEAEISSPSLFNASPTTSSQDSSLTITVQKLY